MAETRPKNMEPLIFVGAAVLALIVMVTWSFRLGDFASGSFKMNEVSICEELDENLMPVSADRNISPESQQVCLWFDYSGARKGDAVEISWYLDGRTIQREIVILSERAGARAFYLLKEDGSPLDPGFYSININRNGKDAYEGNFTVYDSSGDVFPGNVVIWD